MFAGGFHAHAKPWAWHPISGLMHLAASCLLFCSLRSGLGSPFTRTLPQAKSALERIHVIALACAWRQVLQAFHIPAAEHDIIGLEGRDQKFYHVGHVASPFGHAVLFKPAN